MKAEQKELGITEQQAVAIVLKGTGMQLIANIVCGLRDAKLVEAGEFLIFGPEYPNRQEAAERAVIEANRYATFLSVLGELQRQTKLNTITIAATQPHDAGVNTNA